MHDKGTNPSKNISDLFNLFKTCFFFHDCHLPFQYNLCPRLIFSKIQISLILSPTLSPSYSSPSPPLTHQKLRLLRVAIRRVQFSLLYAGLQHTVGLTEVQVARGEALSQMALQDRAELRVQQGGGDVDHGARAVHAAARQCSSVVQRRGDVRESR